MLKTPYNHKSQQYKPTELGKSKYGKYQRFINNETKKITVKITSFGDRITEIQEAINILIEEWNERQPILDATELKLSAIEIHNKRLKEQEKKEKLKIEKLKKEQEKLKKEQEEFKKWKNSLTTSEVQ